MVAQKFKRMILPVLIGMVMAVALPFHVLADDSTQTSGDTVLTQESKDPLLKRMPSRNYLSVVYADGILTLDSPMYEGKFTLSFEDNETGETYIVPFIHVGDCVAIALPAGEYAVTAIGESGITLNGLLQLM